MKKFILICLLLANCQERLDLDREIILKGVDIYNTNGELSTCEYTVEVNYVLLYYGKLKIYCNDDNYSNLIGKKIKIQIVEDTK